MNKSSISSTNELSIYYETKKEQCNGIFNIITTSSNDKI